MLKFIKMRMLVKIKNLLLLLALSYSGFLLAQDAQKPSSPADFELEIFEAFDLIARVGEAICFGVNSGDALLPNLTAYFNGKPAKVDEEATLGCAMEGCVCFRVPEGAEKFHYPPFYLTLEYQGKIYKTKPLPFKVLTKNEITSKSSISPFHLQSGQTVYNNLSYAFRQEYVLNLSKDSLINLYAISYDAMHNKLNYKGGKPDLILKISNPSGFNIIADDSDDSLNPKLKNLFLKAGRYFIKVSRKDKTDPYTGFYVIRYDLIKAPYITAVIPAVGLAGDVITIKGCNFSDNSNELKVEFISKEKDFSAEILEASYNTLKVKVPEAIAQKGESYLIKITNLKTNLSSEEEQVKDNNQNAIFYFIDKIGDTPENAFSPAELIKGKIGYGVLGKQRARYSLRAYSDIYVVVKASFLTPSGEVVSEIAPKIEIKDSKGTPIPCLDKEFKNGKQKAVFFLPDIGCYTLSLQALTQKPVLYKVSYSTLIDYKREDKNKVDSIEILSENWQVIYAKVRYPSPVPIWEKLPPVKVKVSYKGKPVSHIPVIFATPRSSCTQRFSSQAITDENGIASVSSIKISRPPIIGKIDIYPADYTRLKTAFYYIFLPEVSCERIYFAPTCVSIPSAPKFQLQDIYLNFIPFDFAPRLNEEVRVYVLVWDKNGNPLPNVQVEIVEHNFNPEENQGRIIKDFTKTDQNGLAYCLVRTSAFPDGKTHACGFGLASGFTHYLKVRAGNSDASFYFTAIVQ